jgi:hypothetical protein
MKYHHLERCFTYRMKRPMVAVVFGLLTVKVWDYRWYPHFHGRRLIFRVKGVVAARHS